jgi:hypothetical protein
MKKKILSIINNNERMLTIINFFVFFTVYTEQGAIVGGNWTPVRVIDIYRLPRLLTTFSSEGRFKFPMALVIKASQERRIPLQM